MRVPERLSHPGRQLLDPHAAGGAAELPFREADVHALRHLKLRGDVLDVAEVDDRVVAHVVEATSSRSSSSVRAAPSARSSSARAAPSSPTMYSVTRCCTWASSGLGIAPISEKRLSEAPRSVAARSGFSPTIASSAKPPRQ